MKKNRTVPIILISVNILLFPCSSFAQRLDSVDSLQKMVDEIVRELSNSLKMNKQLMEERTQLKQEIEELTKTNQNLQKGLAELKGKEASFLSYEETLKEYQAKLTESKSRIEELEQLKASLEEKLRGYEELSKAKQELEERLDEYSDLKKELDSYQATNSQLQETLREYQTEIAQDNTKITELEQLKNSSIEELEQKLRASQQDEEEMKASLEAESRELKNNLAAKDEELEKYRVSKALAEDNIEKLIEQINMQRKRVFESLYEAGKANALAKKYKEALSNFEECLKINPNSADVHYNLGILYQYEYGDRVGAIRHLKKYLELNPQAKDRNEIEFLLDMLQK